jgi:hypothetical protein
MSIGEEIVVHGARVGDAVELWRIVRTDRDDDVLELSFVSSYAAGRPRYSDRQRALHKAHVDAIDARAEPSTARAGAVVRRVIVNVPAAVGVSTVVWRRERKAQAAPRPT